MKSSTNQNNSQNNTRSICARLFCRKPKKDTATLPNTQIDLQEITSIFDAMSATGRPSTTDILKEIRKNMPYANEITCALIYFYKKGLYLSPEIIQVLTSHGKYAVEVAMAMVYASENDLFLSQRNIAALANAEALAPKIATDMVWFSFYVSSKPDLISEILDALASTDQVDDAILALTLLDCANIPLTKQTIQAVVQVTDPIQFAKTLWSLKNDGIALSDNIIKTLAETRSPAHASVIPANASMEKKSETTRTRSGIIDNYFINIQSRANHKELASPKDTECEKIRLLNAMV